MNHLESELTLAPLGAGDLIDRAIRLYRRHFFTLIRIAAPPVLVAAAGSVLIAISFRQISATSFDASLALFVLLLLVGAGLFAGGHVFNLIVMGGATRNLVTHMLWNEPVSVRTTYAAVRKRFWGLLGATLLVIIWVGLAAFITFFAWYIVVAVVVIGSALFAMVMPAWVAVVVGTIAGIAAAVLALWLFFFLAGRVAYVPQAMLVEGKGVFDALGRSFSLARGNVRRLMAMALFTTLATYSAWSILLIPLSWYGYINGINPLSFGQTEWPVWYLIGYNVIGQTSYILLAPVWMLGLCLLYVDERVRHEGYDVELMAARQLSEMPKLNVSSPLAPAISLEVAKRSAPPPPPMATGSVLGLS